MCYYTEYLRRAFHGFLCFLIAFNQLFPAYAQIVADPTAPAANQASLTNAPNGVDVLNIVRANGAGISHNQFTDYNVSTDGLILNNSQNFGASALGGVILGNPNMAGGGEASKIINEVTSANPSVLQGFTEVFGANADVIVANPNGITCDGCGFINTPRATLTTGTPQFIGNALSNISVNDGTITINGTGLNVVGNKAEILSRAVAINADIQAGEIEIITGRNDIDPATNITVAKAPDGSPSPALAVDSAALGGMYAGKITLLGTENGVGFRLLGDVATSASDLVITNDGTIEIANTASEANLSITTTGTHDIDIDGAVTSEGETNLDSSASINLTADTTIESHGVNTRLKAADTITSNQAAVVGYQNLTLNAANITNNEGLFISGDDLTVQGVVDGTNVTVIDNLAGGIESINGNVSIRADTLNNIGSASTTTQTDSYWFRFRQSTVPGWVPNGPDLTNAGYAQLYDGNSTYTIAAHPDHIQDIVEASGQSLSDFYDAGNNRYVFEVSDWLALAPGNTTTWNAELGQWALYSPDEAQNAPSNGYIIAQVVTDELVAGSYKPAGISAQSGDVNIEIATQLTNDKSYISAANDLSITGTGNLTNLAEALEERLVQRTSYGNGTTLRETGWGAWFSSNSYRQLTSTTIDTISAPIAAGGSNTITLGGDVVSVTTPVNALSSFDFAGQSSGIIRSTLETGNTASPLFLNSGLVQPSSNANYKFETRFDFADFGAFFGSDYFAVQLFGGGFDPDTLSRRLGDAYIENKLIISQILNETGKKYLGAGIGSDADQVKALIDNGVAAGTALALTPFIALTSEQQAALTQDIVWYEERVIDGETLLVPQLYLAQATFDETGSKLRGATFSGDALDINAQDISFDLARATANQDVNLIAADNITSISGVIDGNNVNLNAGENITLATGETGTGTAKDSGVVQDLIGQVEAKNDINIDAGNNLSVIGSNVTAGGDINAKAEEIVVSAAPLTSSLDRTTVDGANIVAQQIDQHQAQINAGGSATLNALNNLIVRGSEINARDNINLSAVMGDVIIESAEETRYEKFKSDTTDATSQRTTAQASKLNTENGDVNIRSTLGNVTLKASEIDSGNDINLTADTGKVELLAAVDREFDQKISSKSNPVWQSSEDKGGEHETVRHTILTGEGDLNITAANGVTIQYRETGNLDEDIAQLSQAPGLEWMADLQNDPNVDWDGIVEVHRDWSDKQEGLSGPAAAVIAIAIAIATQQYQLGAMLLEGTALATSTTAVAATNAAVAALASQAGISLINNKGDLGAVFNELASADTVRSVAAAALTAGLLDAAGVANLDVSGDFFAPESVLTNIQDQLIAAGIRSGVDTVVTGADFSESLKSNLRFAGAAVIGAQLSQEIGIEFAKGEIDPNTGISRGVQLIAHAATGCVVGAVGTGNCGAGAAGQLAGELSGLLYKGDMTPAEIDAQTQEWKSRGVDIARLSGALAAALAGGDANDVNLGSDAGGTAVANNALCGGACIALAAIALSSAYAASQGDNLNPIDGLQAIGRGEDPIGKAITAVYDGTTDQIAIVAAGAFPEATQEAFELLQAAGELGSMGVEYVDELSGKRISTTWDKVPQGVKEGVLGGTIVASYAFSGAALYKGAIAQRAAISNTTSTTAGLASKFKSTFPENPGQVQHIFRNAKGHLPDTPANRQLLLDVSNSKANYVGTDEFGKQWFSKTLDNGSQVWGASRNGVIQNGGLNDEYIDLAKRYSLKK